MTAKISIKNKHSWSGRSCYSRFVSVSSLQVMNRYIMHTDLGTVKDPGLLHIGTFLTQFLEILQMSLLYNVTTSISEQRNLKYIMIAMFVYAEIYLNFIHTTHIWNILFLSVTSTIQSKFSTFYTVWFGMQRVCMYVYMYF